MAIDTEFEEALLRVERAIADLRSLGLARSWEKSLAPPDFADEVVHWNAVDWPRRQRPAWERRGHLMSLVADKDGSMLYPAWVQAARALGYKSAQGLNGFFAGTPPVFIREGDYVRLTPRGFSGAAYWRGRYAK